MVTYILMVVVLPKNRIFCTSLCEKQATFRRRSLHRCSYAPCGILLQIWTDYTPHLPRNSSQHRIKDYGVSLLAVLGKKERVFVGIYHYPLPITHYPFLITSYLAPFSTKPKKPGARCVLLILHSSFLILHS